MSGSRGAGMSGARGVDSDPMLIRIPLMIAGWARPLLSIWGIEERSFRQLLRARLLIGHRRAAKSDAGAKAWRRLGQIAFLFMYALVGVGIGIVLYVVPDVRHFTAIAITASMVLLAGPLTLDMLPSLMDTSDLRVVAPLPVSERSVMAARLVHLCAYVLSILTALGVAPAVMGSLEHGTWMFAPAYAICLLLAGVATSLATLAFYLAALRSVDLARFRDAMVWFQCGVLVLFYAAMQLGPRVAERLGLIEWLQHHPDLVAAFPPCWFGPLLALLIGEGHFGDLIPVACIVASVVAILLLLRAVSGRRMLTQLAASEEGVGRVKAKRSKRGLAGRLGRRWIASGVGRAGLEFALAEMASQRGFRLRVIPSVAVMAFPMIGFVFSSDSMRFASFIPYLPYFATVAAFSAVAQMAYADRSEASWCFVGLDARERSAFARGASLAVLIRFAMLPFAAIGIVQLVYGDLAGLSGFLFAVSIGLVLLRSGVSLAVDKMPFSQEIPREANPQGGANLIVSMLGLGVAALAQFAIGFIPYGLWIAAVAAAVFVARSLTELKNGTLVIEPVALVDG